MRSENFINLFSSRTLITPYGHIYEAIHITTGKTFYWLEVWEIASYSINELRAALVDAYSDRRELAKLRLQSLKDANA